MMLDNAVATGQVVIHPQDARRLQQNVKTTKH